MVWIRNQRSGKQLCKIFVKNFEGNNTGVGTAQQQQQQNQYDVAKTDASTDAAATGMTYMLSIRELAYLNQTSLSLKNFKIRGVIGNTG